MKLDDYTTYLELRKLMAFLTEHDWVLYSSDKTIGLIKEPLEITASCFLEALKPEITTHIYDSCNMLACKGDLVLRILCRSLDLAHTVHDFRYALIYREYSSIEWESKSYSATEGLENLRKEIELMVRVFADTQLPNQHYRENL
jgi:hypothetical protein